MSDEVICPEMNWEHCRFSFYENKHIICDRPANVSKCPLAKDEMIEFEQNEVKVVRPGEVLDLNIKDPRQEAKSDEGKPDFTLVPTAIFYEIEKVRQYGNKKYHDPDNWRQVSKERYFKAMLRHILACWDDMEKIDEESKLMHLSHIGCNLAFIMQLIKEEKDVDTCK